MAKKPQHVGPSFGGKNFFPTHAPRPIVALCRKVSFSCRAVEKAFCGIVKWKGITDELGKLFFARPAVAHVHVNQVPTTLPVCIHRGTFVNTRHQAAYIAPKKVRIANGEWNGGAA